MLLLSKFICKKLLHM